MLPTDRYRRQLLRRLSELGVRLDGIERELLSHADPDWAEQAVERSGDEVLEALGEAGQREIGMIRSALDRIQKGSYGRCQSCGEKIGDDRLSALPATPMCRECAKAAET